MTAYFPSSPLPETLVSFGRSKHARNVPSDETLICSTSHGPRTESGDVGSGNTIPKPCQVMVISTSSIGMSYGQFGSSCAFIRAGEMIRIRVAAGQISRNRCIRCRPNVFPSAAAASGAGLQPRELATASPAPGWRGGCQRNMEPSSQIAAAVTRAVASCKGLLCSSPNQAAPC
jgi:hypothetical protein